MPKRYVLPEFGHWLAGFLDGEGCFFLKVVNRRQCGAYLQAHCAVSLRADDRGILEEIATVTGLGRVVDQKRHGSHSKMAAWIVESKADRFALIELLDEFPLRAKKRRDYALWREALFAYDALGLRPGARPAEAEPPDLSVIEDFVQRLKNMRTFSEVAYGA
jgi:hypothetical protein